MDSTSLARAREALDQIAAHCIAARSIIEEAGTPVMLHLVDLLLFEIGVALAEGSDEQDPAGVPTA